MVTFEGYADEIYVDPGEELDVKLPEEKTVTVKFQVPTSAAITRYSVTIKQDGSYSAIREW